MKMRPVAQRFVPTVRSKMAHSKYWLIAMLM